MGLPAPSELTWTIICGFINGIWLAVCLMPWWVWILVVAVLVLRLYAALGRHFDRLAFARGGIRRRRR